MGQKGHVNNIPTKQFSLEFPEISSQNLISDHWLSLCRNAEIKHSGMLTIYQMVASSLQKETFRDEYSYFYKTVRLFFFYR